MARDGVKPPRGPPWRCYGLFGGLLGLVRWREGLQREIGHFDGLLGLFRGMNGPFSGGRGPSKNEWGPPSDSAPLLTKNPVCASECGLSELVNFICIQTWAIRTNLKNLLFLKRPAISIINEQYCNYQINCYWGYGSHIYPIIMRRRAWSRIIGRGYVKLDQPETVRRSESNGSGGRENSDIFFTLIGSLV